MPKFTALSGQVLILMLAALVLSAPSAFAVDQFFDERPPVEEGPPPVTNEAPPVVSPVNTFGLFQPESPPDTSFNNDNSGYITLEQPKMFLFQGFGNWTQRILEQAADFYRETKGTGVSDADALQQTVNYLQEAGMDQEVASSLLLQVQQGQLQVADSIKLALETMAK